MPSVSSGIRRKVDDLGRVVIPAGIRRSLNIREGDAVEVSVDGERVVLTKPRDACVFCGREGDDLHRFRSRLLCRECVASVGRMDGELQADQAAAYAPPAAPASPVAAPPPPDPSPTPPGGTAGPRSGPAAATSDAPPWPTGPIDGDAWARAAAQRRTDDAR